jgi:sterol desaturase/sphingolipid hydroxylase (fatty acid hydroxylase superfamily)
MLKKLKRKWEISSNFQLVIIFIVFAITGSSAAYAAKPLMEFIQLERESFQASNWGGVFYYLLRILLIFPIYQVLLVFIGTVFGQFQFFWNFEKKMLKRLGLGFLFG